MRKKWILWTASAIVIIGAIGLYYWHYSRTNIPQDYVAIFIGQSSAEISYSTYIYKIDNGHDNYGFKYINVTTSTVSWGSSQSETRITGEGKFDWTDGAFIIARENNAYSYVLLPDGTIMSPEEFMSKFIMN
ncbi:MAG: hypothetical protein LBL34_00075 [Clostridiales bacterium]|jgi:hypothetical protein|nr:hypothetical protein [Clostridiales bacterium]